MVVKHLYLFQNDLFYKLNIWKGILNIQILEWIFLKKNNIHSPNDDDSVSSISLNDRNTQLRMKYVVEKQSKTTNSKYFIR